VKAGQFTADDTGEGSVSLRKPKNLTEEGVVRKTLSPRRVADVPNLSEASELGTYLR